MGSPSLEGQTRGSAPTDTNSPKSVNNTLLENKALSSRILLENIPSGQDFLATVMEAMKKSKLLEITYKGYWSEHEHTFPVAPYCVKLFRQRWYLVGNSIPSISSKKSFGMAMLWKCWNRFGYGKK